MTSRASRAREARGRRSRLARAGMLALVLAALAALGLLASSCGGSSGEGVAQVDSSETTTTDTGSSASTGSSGSSKRDAVLAFSACMRRNGVPTFPDPEVSGGGMRLSLEGIDTNAPQFRNAQRTCRRLLPNEGRSTPQQQAERLQDALDYAACMRDQGVPNFPDPKLHADGGIEWGEVGPSVGIDPKSPQFEAAEGACEALAPGAQGGDAERSEAP